MRDLLEGGNEYDLGLNLQHFIEVNHYFTCEDLNDRIASFEYGMESRNKPIAMKMTKIMKKHKNVSCRSFMFSTQHRSFDR